MAHYEPRPVDRVVMLAIADTERFKRDVEEVARKNRLDPVDCWKVIEADPQAPGWMRLFAREQRAASAAQVQHVWETIRALK